MERNAQADALDTARNTGAATKASARKAGDQHRPAPLNCLESEMKIEGIVVEMGDLDGFATPTPGLRIEV